MRKNGLMVLGIIMSVACATAPALRQIVNSFPFEQLYDSVWSAVVETFAVAKELRSEDLSTSGVNYYIDRTGVHWMVNGGLYHKTRKEDSWVLVNSSITSASLIFVDSRGYVFVYVNAIGLLRSLDNGVSFSTVFPTPNSICFCFTNRNMDEDTAGNLFIGLYGLGLGSYNARKVWRSTNGGAIWSLVLQGGGGGNNHTHCLGCDPYRPGYVYVAFGDGPEIYRSTSYGDFGSWTLVTTKYAVTQIVFSPNYRLYGEDYHQEDGQLDKFNSRIIRTSDDINYTPVYTPVAPYKYQLWPVMSVDRDGRIFAYSYIELSEGNWSHPHIVVSEAEPYTAWTLVKDFGLQTTMHGGINGSVNHDDTGWGYFVSRFLPDEIAGFISHARKPRAFIPGDKWHPRAKRRPFIFLAKSSGL